jgi:hypothetical protein
MYWVQWPKPNRWLQVSSNRSVRDEFCGTLNIKFCSKLLLRIRLLDRKFHMVARIQAYPLVHWIGLGSTRGSNLTLAWWRSATAATAAEISVDGDGIWRRCTLETMKTIRGLGRRQQRGCEVVMFEEIFNVRSVGIYIPFSYRYHRTKQLGLTEMHNCQW